MVHTGGCERPGSVRNGLRPSNSEPELRPPELHTRHSPTAFADQQQCHDDIALTEQESSLRVRRFFVAETHMRTEA